MSTRHPLPWKSQGMYFFDRDGVLISWTFDAETAAELVTAVNSQQEKREPQPYTTTVTFTPKQWERLQDVSARLGKNFADTIDEALRSWEWNNELYELRHRAIKRGYRE